MSSPFVSENQIICCLSGGASPFDSRPLDVSMQKVDPIMEHVDENVENLPHEEEKIQAKPDTSKLANALFDYSPVLD